MLKSKSLFVAETGAVGSPPDCGTGSEYHESCGDRCGTSGAHDLALIQGELPSLADWEEIRRRELTVNVLELPGGSSSLEPLTPWSEWITHLTVNSYSCSDLRALPEFTKLEYLAIGGRVTHAPKDFAPPGLVVFAGPYRRFEALARSAHLQSATITLGRNTVPARLGPALRQLSLLSAASLVDLRLVDEIPDLEELTIHGAKALDLSHLRTATSLRSLHFESCARLTQADAMLAVQGLETLWLEDITEILPIGPLSALQAEVRVVGRHGFDASFQRQVGTNWTFP